MSDYDKSYTYKKWKVNVKYNNNQSIEQYLQDIVENTLEHKIDREINCYKVLKGLQ